MEAVENIGTKAQALVEPLARGAGAPEPFPDSNRPSPRPSSTAEVQIHVCPRCNQDYVRPFPGRVCWDCEEKDRRAAELCAERRRVCGIGPRHMKLLGWEELRGPEAYLRAVASARAFVEGGDSILGLIGKRGTGKTQLGAVAVWQTIERGRSARMVTAMALLADLKGRFGDASNAEGEWLGEWSAPYLLVVDEVAELVTGDHGRAMFAALLDERYRLCRPSIVIGNLSADQFVGCVGTSVADRCNEGGGLVAYDGWPSFRVQVAGGGRQLSAQAARRAEGRE